MNMAASQHKPTRDEIGALSVAIRAAVECAITWGWNETQFTRLARYWFAKHSRTDYVDHVTGEVDDLADS
jgi:hypothetical protein